MSNYLTIDDAPWGLKIHMQPSDRFAYDDLRQVYVVRNELWEITGWYSSSLNFFTPGLPAWMELVAAPEAIEEQGVIAQHLVSMETVVCESLEGIELINHDTGREPVDEVSCDAATELFEVDCSEAHAQAQVEAQAERQAPFGDRMYQLMLDAANGGTLTSFHFTTKAGVSGGWMA